MSTRSTAGTPLAAVILAWFAASVIGWFGLLVVELALHAAVPESPMGAIAYLSTESALYGLAASAVLAVIRGVYEFLPAERRVRLLASTALVVAGSTYPCWLQAEALSSGDGIGGSPLAGFVGAGLFAALLTAQVLLWVWHVHRTRPSVSAEPLLLSLELAALAGLLYLLSFELQVYLFLARFLTIPLWLVAATITYRYVRMAPRAFIAIVGGVLTASCVVSVAAPDDYLEARTDIVEVAPVAGLTDQRFGFFDAPSGAQFDIAEPPDEPCPPARPVVEPPALEIPPSSRKNVILVSVDALRADAVGARVGGRPVAPEMRAFASRSLDFERAVTPYPATLLSVASALTGLDALQILLSRRVPPNVFQLTRGRFDSSIAMLPDVKWFTLPVVDRLFLQGVVAERHETDAQRTSAFIARLSRLRREHRTTIAWLHLYSPHQPYESHPEHDFGRNVRSRYLSEVAHADRQFGRLVRYLEEDGWLQDSLIVFFADHGQALGERDYIGHHVYLDAWITDVPLWVHYPGVSPARIETVVSLSDVAPTVAHFSGTPTALDVEERSLLVSGRKEPRSVVGQAFPLRGTDLYDLLSDPLVSEEDVAARLDLVLSGARNYLPKVALMTTQHRLIVNRVTGLTSVYDRNRDPTESQDLSRTEPELTAELLEQLDAWHAERSEEIYCSLRE